MPGTRADTSDPGWFIDLFGFKERDYEETKGNFEMNAAVGELTCKVNKRPFMVGEFQRQSLELLRLRKDKAVDAADDRYFAKGSLSFENIVEDVRELHLDIDNEGQVFQVASLYNCLETVKKGQGVEAGVSDYANRPCQGAAAAMSCPAATVFRNYFLHQQGESRDKVRKGEGGAVEVDCLCELGKFLNNKEEKIWNCVRGFCLPLAAARMVDLSTKISTDPVFEQQVEEKVQVGVHWNTEVASGTHEVCQVVCSCLPVACMKSRHAEQWHGLAGALLEAAFDATLAVATILAAQRTKRVTVYLTALGGGELGNRPKWIHDALNKVLNNYEGDPLDVKLVHYSEVPDIYLTLEDGRQRKKAKGGADMSQTVQMKQIKRTKSYADALALAGTDGAASLVTAFAHMDTNGDGVLDKAEMMRILQNIDADFFTPHVVNILFKEADCDGDGSIHYTEFVNWIIDEDEDIANMLLEHCK